MHVAAELEPNRQRCGRAADARPATKREPATINLPDGPWGRLGRALIEPGHLELTSESQASSRPLA